MIITGGSGTSLVTKYEMKSAVSTTWEELPELLSNRAWHACGKYVDDNKQAEKLKSRSSARLCG